MAYLRFVHGILAIFTCDILAICAHLVIFALHTCDFAPHTCDLNRKYGLKKYIASMIQIASTREKIASSNRKYGGAWNLKSQVWSGILAIFSTCTCDLFPM